MANYILDGLVHLLCIISHNSEKFKFIESCREWEQRAEHSQE